MHGFSFVDMWNSMGLLSKGITIFMLIMAVFMVAIIIERGIRFYNGSKQSFDYVVALRQQLQRGNVEAAIQAAKQYAWSPIAKVMEAGLSEYRAGLHALKTEGPDEVGDFDLVDAVNRALDRVKERETSNLRRGLGGLATVASAAPFVGLLGTVIGIINAFGKLSGGGGMDVVGPGISEALVNTAVGLGVAIPAAMFFNFFTGLVERFVVDMNDVSSEFVGYVLKEGRSSK
jgi:biopolymer transport protein ExbB/TolQ